MLSSGIFEAIGMFQGYQDASEKLADAKQKVADLEEQGAQNTKEYAEATKDASDAQRGFNFIQRFTIQSFADLMPMSLMLTSSVLDMTGKMGGLASMKTKLAGAVTKLTGAFSAMGVAMMAFTRSHPILLLLTALAAAAVALITNFGGARDRVNELGVALGNMLGPAKPILEWFGAVMNQAADGANSLMNFGQTATAQLSDVEGQMVKTGDVSTLMFTDQIRLMGELSEEGENVYFSLGAHLKKQTDAEEEHNEKYKEFVMAMTSGNDALVQSLGLTEEQFNTLYDEWQKDIEEFDTAFNAHVDTIVQNYQTFNEEARAAQEGLIEDYVKLNEKLMEHYQKRDEGEKMDKEARKQWRDDLALIMGDIDTLKDKVSEQAFAAADSWNQFKTITTEAFEKFKLEAISGNFNQAIEHIKTASDQVPEKYKANFEPLNEIISNPMLSAQAKADIVVAHMNTLDPYKSFVVGATEYTRKQAEVASTLDELAVKARENVTTAEGMDKAWAKFIASMSPAQKDLPIVKSAIEGVASGAISAGKGFAMVEAAGRTMSATLGTTVTQSFEDLQKTVIVFDDGTKKAFGEINGQVVDLGTVTDAQLVSGGKSVSNSMIKTADTASTELGTNTTKSITDLAKEGKVQFLAIDTAMATTQTAMKTTSTTTSTETKSWLTDFENFKTEAVKYLGEVQKTLDTLWQSAKERLGNTNFQNLLPSIGTAEGSEEGQQVPVQSLDQLMSGGSTGGGVPGGMNEQQVKSLHSAWSSFSTSMATYSNSITASITKIQTAASTLSTSMATYATSMKTNFGAFGTAFVGIVNAIIPIITLLQGTFSTLSTSVMTYATSMTTNTSNWVITSITSMGELVNVILVTQGVYSTFSTSVSTYMISLTTNTANWGIATITTLSEVSKIVLVTQGVYSTFSTSVATYMTSMSQNTANWGITSITAMSNVSKNALTTQGTLSSMSTSVATYMKSMTTNIKNFASSAVSDLNKVASAADKATSALNKMAAAAKKAAEAAAKAKSAGGAGQHGGIFLTGQHGGLFMQTGGFVVDHRQKIGGVTVGEWGKPEEINYDRKSGVMQVTPLTDPNKLHDRGQNINGSTNMTGSGSGINQPINITLINKIDGNEIINDRKLTKKIKLEGGNNFSRFI